MVLLTMRIGRALDSRFDSHEDLLARLCTRWASTGSASALRRTRGGDGVHRRQRRQEDSPMPRLLRESPDTRSGKAAATSSA